MARTGYEARRFCNSGDDGRGRNEAAGNSKPVNTTNRKVMRHGDSYRVHVSPTLPKEIEEMWHAIHFRIETHSRQPLRLDIGKVQFALTGGQRDRSIQILKKNGVALFLNDKNTIQVKFENYVEPKRKTLEYLEAMFEKHVLCGYESISIDLASSEGIQLLSQLSKKIPSEMRCKTVAVYIFQTTETFFVVGKRSEVHNMLINIGLQKMVKPDVTPPRPPERDKLKYTSQSINESLLLGYLGFKEHIKHSFPDAEVYFTQSPPSCVIKQSSDRTINWEDEIRRFLSRVKTQKLAITDDLCDYLLFDQYLSPNESFYRFIKKKLPKALRENVTFYISKSETGEYVLNCLDGDTTKIAAAIEKNIVSIRTKVNPGDDVWRYLDEWSRIKKLVYKKIPTDLVQLCCTSDIHNELQDKKFGQNVIQSIRISLPGHTLTFLKLFGNDLITNIEKHFNVQATIRESHCELSGKSENLQKGEDYLKSELKLRTLRKSMPVGISVECIENRQDEIDKAMKENMCVWDLQNVKRRDKMLKNCEYLASWTDPIRRLSVTVVNGCPWHMNLDLQIVMTNHCLYSVELANASIFVPEDFLLVRRNILEGKQKKMDVGVYTQFLAEVEGSQAKYIVALVIESDKGDTRSRNFDLKQKLVEILKTGVERKVTNFGVNASMGHAADTNVRHTIEAAIEFADTQPGQIEEVFICCQMEQAEVLQNVNEMFRKKCGFLKNIHSGNAKRFKSEGSNIQIEVKEGRLHEMKVDVIVNTTNLGLKLEEDGDSLKIKEMAGHSLVKECKRKYPRGLLPGQVAVTQAHALKELKFIYHICLPDFHVNTFREDVKMYLKKCLCQAERDGCLDIAFPALGVGRLKYPRRETAVAIFDAVEEYSSAIVNPVVRSVTFAVADTMTYKAFAAEKWRRSKRCVSEIGLTKPFIKSDFRALVFKAGAQCPSIKITTLADFGMPPAYAIEVFFGYDTISRKGAFDEPPSCNDRWFLKRVDRKSDVTESLREFLRKLKSQKDRVTEIIFYTNDDIRLKVSTEQQVESICSFFKEMAHTFLKEVIIVVSDETYLQRTEKLLQKDKQMSGSWNETDNRSSSLSIEVIGKTRSCVDDGQKFIENLVLEIEKEITTTVVSRLSMIPEIRTSSRQHLKDSDGDSKVENEVTAELNRGIVSFKQNTNEWDAWVIDVENIFRLKVNVLSDKVTVAGSFNSILNFESYLDKFFPNTPSDAENS